ncbi:sulfatase family protein [Candidatus Puniceispirillum sp.]|jgi:arylsulfatase|uniref:sulfatase family protein n=1 Tax=Candidatus Puniceispirillum sp. TaxID=2026719 RepID=UPI001EB4FD2A|nr:sulfatase-like hydrolase/transferase [Candidatus Puniceispirillum sp.]
MSARTDHQKPNIVLIMTDQQRADTIAELGHPWMQTPNLDRLVKQGTSFTNCFVTSPVCVSSRASVFLGAYPHTTNVYTNFEIWQPNWVNWLAQAGYHCVNIGKMHINPYDAKGGFHQRFFVENKDRPLFLEDHERALYDEWDKALKAHGLEKPSRYTRVRDDRDAFLKNLGCFTWETDDDMHPDNFVGDTAIWWLEDRKADSPFFLQIGFPGPHPPYDPTDDFLALYKDTEFPHRAASQQEVAEQPKMHQQLRQSMVDFNIDSVAWRENLTDEDIQRLHRYYSANVSMIDQKVGQIMDSLDKQGYLDNTIIIFCSDHADALGEHGHIQKWTMYDCVTRVPLVFWAPNWIKQQQQCGDLVQLMDIAPTILNFAGIKTPENWEALALNKMLTDGVWDDADPETTLRQYVYAELGRDHIQSGAEYVIMRRDKHWKYVIYPGSEEGELYNLTEDPRELKNLWNEPDLREQRKDAAIEILSWSSLGNFRGHRPPPKKPQVPMKI